MFKMIKMFDEIEPVPIQGVEEVASNLGGLILTVTTAFGVVVFLAGLFVWLWPGKGGDAKGKKMVVSGFVVSIVSLFINQILGIGESIFETILG